MIAPLSYAAGCDFIQHRSGQRLDRENALRARAYHERVAADHTVMPERRANSAEMIRQINAAIAATWAPIHQKEIAR
jgi:hypothetical protein